MVVARTALLVLAVVIAATILSGPASATSGLPDTVGYAESFLEGVWLLGKPANKGECRANWYGGATQIEFEFRKSAGRVLFFEPYDLFTAVQIADLALSGDALILRAVRRDNRRVNYMRIHLLDADRIELVIDNADGSAPARVETAYRCGPRDSSVNETVAMEDLSLLTPVLSGGATFPQTVDGVPDNDICTGKGDVERLRKRIDQASIQFELLGSVHFWAFGIQYGAAKHVQEFDHVRSVRRVAPDTLKLVLQKPANYRQGWDAPGPEMPTYELTVIVKGSRFEIPELSATFIRCDPPAPGMHRWG